MIALAIFGFGIGIALCLLPIIQWIGYKIMCKQYGKDMTDKIIEHWRR